MKRMILLGGLLVTAAASLLWLARGTAPAQTTSPPPCGTEEGKPSAPVCEPPARAVPVSRPRSSRPVHPAVADLIAFLGQTRSKDAFTAAVVALAEMGPRARPAIPAILTNGERLGVFTGAFSPDGQGRNAQGAVAVEALALIAQGRAAGPDDYTPPPPDSRYPVSYRYGFGLPMPTEEMRRPEPLPPPPMYYGEAKGGF
jgi:hypothetical protein